MCLKLDFCDDEAASFAAKFYHYSKCLPAGKMVKIGVWEDDKFIGAVIFSRGANRNLLKPYGLEQTEGCELARVALSEHKAATTRIVAIAIRLLRKTNPGLQLIVSFADSAQGHKGKIYQAGNWIYAGKAISTPDYLLNGRWQRSRSVHSIYGTVKGLEAPQRPGGFKYRYLYPLTEAMKTKVELLRQQPPK